MKPSLLILISSFAILGCQPKKVNSLGPEATLQDVRKAITEPLANFTALAIEKGDIVLLNDTLYIATNPPVITKADQTEIFDRTEDDNAIYISMKQLLETYRDGMLDHRVRKHHEFGFKKRQSPEDEKPSQQPEGLTFHNLVVSKTRIPPPEAVRQQARCLDIPNCLLDATLVSVDKVIWNPQKYDKVHMEWVMTPQVPYLASVLSQCSSMLIVVQSDGQNVPAYVKVCTDAVDFRYGFRPSATRTRPLFTRNILDLLPRGAAPGDWAEFDPLAVLTRSLRTHNPEDYLPTAYRPHSP